MVGDPLDLVFDRELVLRLPGLDNPSGGRLPLELGHEELPLPPLRLESRDHLRAVEDDVAGPHVELVDDRLAQVQEQVVHRRQDELPSERGAAHLVEAVLDRPQHGPLAASQEAFREPPFRLELPQPQPRLPHVVLEPRVRGERLRGRHPEASDDPPQDLAASLVPADLDVRDGAVAVVPVAGHVEAFVQFPERRGGRGPAQVG